jgi:hypothetical protein
MLITGRVLSELGLYESKGKYVKAARLRKKRNNKADKLNCFDENTRFSSFNGGRCRNCELGNLFLQISNLQLSSE